MKKRPNLPCKEWWRFGRRRENPCVWS